MRKLAGFFAALAALALAFRFGGGAQDVSELVPVQALVIDAQNGEITVTADTQDVGRGGSLDAALSDLRAGCAGTLFTQTAEHVVLTQKAWFLMPQVCVSAQLRPAAKLYRAVGQSISAERALSFLQAPPGELTLSRARAALRGICMAPARYLSSRTLHPSVSRPRLPLPCRASISSARITTAGMPFIVLW